MPQGEGTYGNQVGRPPKNQRSFVLKRYKNGGYYKQFSNGVVDSIKKPVAEKLIADKRAGKANTKHYTVEFVRMKGVQDPEKVPKGEAREKIVAENKKKSILSPKPKQVKNVQEASAQARKNRTSGRIKTDSNTKPPTRIKSKGGKAGMLLSVLSALGIGASTSKKSENKKTPTKKRTSVPPSKSEGSKNVKAQFDSKEEIKKRMQKDKDNQPVDFKGNYPVYRKGSSMAKSFRKKYNEEKAKGSKTFTWQGRKYTTK